MELVRESVHRYCKPRVEVVPSQADTNAFDESEMLSATFTVSSCGPGILTDGITALTATTVVKELPQALKKLHRVAANEYAAPLCSSAGGRAIGRLSLKREFRNRVIAVMLALGAVLVTAKDALAHGLPPEPVELDKSSISESQIPEM